MCRMWEDFNDKRWVIMIPKEGGKVGGRGIWSRSSSARFVTEEEEVEV